MESNLKQTKSSFKVIGKVTRIDRDGAFREETMKEGHRREGETYRALRFGVKTSDSNEITVGTFDYEPKEVFLWNSEKKKNDANYKGDRIPFGTWEDQQEELREKGYAILQTRVGLTHDDKGKLQSKGLPRYVASQEIYENINNGDSVVVEGEIRYSRYTNNNGEEIEQKNYTIEKLFKIKDVDFDDEKFEEVSYFEQEMVFVDVDIDKKEGKAYVTGRTIDYMKNFIDSQFIIDFTDGEGGYDAGMVKLAEAFKSRFKFGDVINVFGDTLNRVVVEEADEEESEEDALLASLGGKSKPKHAEKWSSRTYITEMQIHGVDAWDKGVYTDDDFIEDEIIDSGEGNGLFDELGGKSKPKGINPFESDGEPIDISDDDLPF